MQMPVDKHVVDTNVLLVASAAHDASPFAPDATPVEDAELRKRVLDWVIDFEQSPRQIVLDYGWTILGEYQNKLTEQDYALQIVLQMTSTERVRWFVLEQEADGRTHIAHAALDLVITDLADRKLVAGVLAAGCRAGGCTLVNCCDTDWYDWQTDLEAGDVYVEQLIHEWCHAKWKSKHVT
jgi:hypothetical protein